MNKLLKKSIAFIAVASMAFSLCIVDSGLYGEGYRGDNGLITANALTSKKALIEMDVYKYISPTAENPNGVIGDKLEDKRLILPQDNYMLKIRLSENGADILKDGVLSLATYIDYDSKKITITSNSTSVNGEVLSSQKDKNIFDSGLKNLGDSAVSFKKNIFDNFITNTTTPTDGVNSLSILQSVKDGNYGDGNKFYKGLEADNVIAAITFSVDQMATSIDDSFLTFESSINEMTVFNSGVTDDKTTYNDQFDKDKLSSVEEFKNTERLIGEPKNIALNIGNPGEGDPTDDKTLNIYYTKDFRDTGFSILDDNGLNYDADYRASRVVTVPGSSDKVDIGLFSSTEKIPSLSMNPNEAGKIEYSYSLRSGVSDVKVDRVLKTHYLRGDVNNDGEIAKIDEVLVNEVNRRIYKNIKLGINEDKNTYFLRAIDVDRDKFSTHHDAFRIQMDRTGIQFIIQDYSYLVK
ncbi:MAG: hypothetical protein KFW09_01415 [Oscillospiraceae bacterium]|nr:hypothetical protein [Oscillospiraceae bacterium]